jgi:type 1 glutamine amidotransferase
MRKPCTTVFVSLALLIGWLACDAGNANEDARASNEKAADAGSRKVKRLLLIGQSPDGHPWSTHEYLAAARLFAKLLQPVKEVQTIIVNADEPWSDGPELLDGADGVVLFVSEGAKWLQQDRQRLAAFQRLAERKGGLTVLHWGMGTKPPEYIDDFVKLFGGCHGGPDRKFKIVTVKTDVAAVEHPVMTRIKPFQVEEEFYYQLKFVRPAGGMTPLLSVTIDDAPHTVAWGWERPAGGRSFGFTGGHYHRNWRLDEYRRLAAQGILWTMNLPVPAEGFPVDVTDQDLELPPPAKPQEK